MRKDALEFFACIPGMRKIPADELRLLTGEILRKEYKKGAILFRKGEPALSVWIVEEGRVDLSHATRSGQLVSNRIATEGDLFCCLPAIDEGPYVSTAICAVRSVIAKISMAKFRILMSRYPEMYRDITAYLCAEWRLTERRIASFFEAAENKIARVLLEMYERFGRDIPLTRLEAAQLAYTAPETAIRVISGFDKTGITSSGRRGVIRLCDLEKLKEKCAP